MTYTLEQIREWKEDYDSIDPNIEGNESKIAELNEILKGLHRELQADLSELQAENNKLIVDIRSQWDLELQQQQLLILLNEEEKERQLDVCHVKAQVLDEVLHQEDIDVVMQLLSKDSANHVEFTPKSSGLIRLINDKLVEKNKHTNARLHNIKHKNRLISNDFMNAYHHDVDTLCEDLQSTLKEALANYEAHHPMGQSERVKRCIFEIYHALDYINNHSNSQDRYAYMVGMVQHVCDQLRFDKTRLTRLLLSSLSANHLLDPVEARHQFDEYRANVHELSGVFIDIEYQRLEKLAYTNAMEQFNQSIKESDSPVWRNLYDIGREYGQAIRKEHDSNPNKFDYKYFSNVLFAAKDVITAPHSDVNRDKFVDLMGFNLAGASNAHRKWKGVGLMLFGAAVAVASVLLGVSMFGISSPLMIAGFAAAGATIMVGLAVFVTGLEKGVAKKGNGLLKNSLFVAEAEPAPAVAQLPRLGDIERVSM